MKELENNIIKLRHFCKNDCENMFNNWCNDPDVAKAAGFPVHESVNQTSKLLDFWIEQYNEKNVFNWAIVEKKTNDIIGSISVVNMNLEDKVCEIGYCIGKKWWNKGYVTNSINLVLKYLFATDLFDVITANCHEDNIGSARVLEKNKFKREGILRNRKIIDGKHINLVQFSILKEEYNEYTK